jgi:hypothetical protein
MQSMGTHGHPLGTHGIHGYPWNAWVLTGTHVAPIDSMGTHGYPWITWVTADSIERECVREAGGPGTWVGQCRGRAMVGSGGLWGTAGRLGLGCRAMHGPTYWPSSHFGRLAVSSFSSS